MGSDPVAGRTNYLGIRHSHFRITLRDWLRGLDKALIAIASALTFILTAMVAMVIHRIHSVHRMVRIAGQELMLRLLRPQRGMLSGVLVVPTLYFLQKKDICFQRCERLL